MSNDNKIMFIKNEKLPLKLNLCYYTTLKFPGIGENNEPIGELLSNYEEIKKIVDLNDSDLLRFIYFNKDKIHKILYVEEEQILVKDKENTNLNLYFYFYLSSLIQENINQVNYTYSINLVIKLNEYQTKEKNKTFSKIIIARIIIDLINNYENDEENELEKIKNYNYDIIEKNINAFKEYGITKKDILENKLDEIYSKIINYLITNKKLEDSENINDLLKEIEIKEIYISKASLDELAKLLDTKNDFIKDYIITNYEDIFDEKKITFYYILLKDILKCNLYIYQIPFLLATKKNILKAIKGNIEEFKKSIKRNYEFKYKIEYVLKAFIEYEFYLKDFLKIKEKSISHNSIEIGATNDRGISSIGSSQKSGYFNSSRENYRKNNPGIEDFFETYVQTKQDKKIEESIIYKIMKKSEFTYTVINNLEVSIKLEKVEIGDEKKIIKDDIKKLSSEDETLNNNYEKFIKVLTDIENKIKNSYTKNDTIQLILTFETPKIEINVYNTLCIYNYVNERMTFKDEDILTKELNEGINNLIHEINID